MCIIVYLALRDLIMRKEDLYKELYSLSKGSVISNILLVRIAHFTALLTKYGVEQTELDDCIIKITASNVYLSTEKLLDKLPPEKVDYINLIKIKDTVLKRLPSFIKTLVNGIPLRVITGQSAWSLNEIVIKSWLVDSEDTEYMERFLGEAYWLIYAGLIDYDGIELIGVMSDLACKKLTGCSLDGEDRIEVGKLYQHAKFNRLKALLKTGNAENNESNVLLELLNLNRQCKE